MKKYSELFEQFINDSCFKNLLIKNLDSSPQLIENVFTNNKPILRVYLDGEFEGSPSRLPYYEKIIKNELKIRQYPEISLIKFYVPECERIYKEKECRTKIDIYLKMINT